METYKKYRIVGEIIKIKLNEVVRAKLNEYRMYKIAMMSYGCEHVRVRLKKPRVCNGCNPKYKSYKRGYFTKDYDMFLCDQCSKSTKAISLHKKEGSNIFYFDTIDIMQISSTPTIIGIELVDCFHIKLHKVCFKTVKGFMRDPVNINETGLKGICAWHFCRFCGCSDICYHKCCDDCHKLRNTLLLDRTCIFMYNDCGFPEEITMHIIDLMISRHSLFIKK